MNDFMFHRTINFSRRRFLFACGAATAAGCAGRHNPPPALRLKPDQIIDVHQHTNYSGRTDEQLIAHQKDMGIALTVLLPAGHPRPGPSTHMGKSDGLAAGTGPNETCYRLVQEHPQSFRFFANEVPDAPNARAEIEKYLKLGAIGIGEQKFGVEIDSPAMQAIYQLAADYDVPVLLHVQHGMYNLGYERFAKMLEKYPRTRFIGHAQTFWANIDAAAEQKNLYPKTPVTRGGLTDRWLSEFPNLFGDISAGSGLNSLLRDEPHARGFLERHQDKILYGSDCNDRICTAEKCQGAKTIAAIKALTPSEAIARKIFQGNAMRVMKV